MQITRERTRALLALLAWHLLFPITASAYAVVLRWDAPPDVAIAGYRLYVRADDGTYGAPRDIVPAESGDPALTTIVADLDVMRTYTFALTAVGFDGSESERSNERTIGYAEAAEVVDSDGDGLPDALEDVNLNGIRDPGETDRLVADSDGDLVPDGVELTQGTDPLDAASPTCSTLAFAEFGFGRGGTAEITWDPDVADDVLRATSTSRAPLRFRASYPARGVASVPATVLATEVRSTARFRIEVTVRSTLGKRYTLRYEGNGGVGRRAGRTLTVALGDAFATRDAWTALGRDLDADLAALDPTATLASVTKIRLSGAYAARALRLCS